MCLGVKFASARIALFFRLTSFSIVVGLSAGVLNFCTCPVPTPGGGITQPTAGRDEYPKRVSRLVPGGSNGQGFAEMREVKLSPSPLYTHCVFVSLGQKYARPSLISFASTR